jgi:hypothetical protein
MIPERSAAIFETIENQKKQLDDLTRDLSNEVFLHKVDKQSWNISEILQHLILSETLSLKYLRKKWSFTPDLPNQNLLTLLRGNLLYLINKVPFKLKAPANVNERSFEKNKSQKELFEEWSLIRKDMKDFLNSLDESDYRKEFYKHPVAGKVNLNHMLLFFHTHIERHTRQLKKILKTNR